VCVVSLWMVEVAVEGGVEWSGQCQEVFLRQNPLSLFFLVEFHCIRAKPL